MTKKLVLTIVCFFCALSFYAQGTSQNKSAEEVWETFNANPAKIYTFIDGITNSDSPKDFIPYIQKFVDTCISRRVNWDDLYDELKETILPKDPDVATYFGVSLCLHTINFSKIMQVLDMLPQNHEFDNLYLENAVLYPDGRILLAFKDENWLDIYNNSENNRYYKGTTIHGYWGDEYPHLLYFPNKTAWLGRLKYAGTDEPLYEIPIGRTKENDKYELYIGYILNASGKEIGEKYMQYNSYSDYTAARNKEYVAQENREIAASSKRTAQIERAMVQKYGRKAYNAISNFSPYVGMPEGIVRDFTVSTTGSVFKAFIFKGILNGYKVYYSNGALRILGQRCPKAVYCINGRVSAVKW